MKREAELKSGLMRLVRDAGFLILDYATSGAPDKALVKSGRTSNWEFKHATPDFESPGNQELFCMRLAHAGHCKYVIWQETVAGTMQRTMIVTPRVVHERQGWLDMLPDAYCTGYDHRWLLAQIEKAHLL